MCLHGHSLHINFGSFRGSERDQLIQGRESPEARASNRQRLVSGQPPAIPDAARGPDQLSWVQGSTRGMLVMRSPHPQRLTGGD